MRSMEEEVEVGGPRYDCLSEDDHSPTDASEDSVEVRVKPIRAPTRPPTRPPTPPTHHKFHKFRKHYSALRQEYTTSPAARASPGVGSPPSPAVQSRPSPPASPLEPPMGAAPLSPGTRAAARSRRKPAEPRRLCHDPANKRSHSPDPPRSSKTLRAEHQTDVGDKSAPSSPSPGAPPLLAHHPLLGTLGRPPMGAFPPLLLPPAWPPVAAQWGYPRMVTPLGWAGLTPGLTPHPYPMLLPHHYPLHRPPLHPHLQPASPPPKSPPPPRSPTEERVVREDLPLPLVTRVSAPEVAAPSPAHHLHHHPPRGTEVSVVRKTGKASSKFLSVESLIASDSPSREAHDLDDDIPSSVQGDPGPADDDDTIHSLLQPNKHKQRNYKNMTRERRIEANARERNRVHTISAAFEKLRTSVPAYSHNQKLSKLSVLRIACSYILSLSRLAGHDYSEGGTEPSFSECVDLTTRTIQVEGKAKKKRDE
ncbi:vegetative cell wall protein gp1-like [Homarus americanus]|uniref:vegetative cell wall protein gp1-like n=1 Tax=Homarus americanus TaxID=6706 RepID=UPI001C44403E|nr:vegetative cell wall protein gp1-like [Homarus americanus]